MQVAAKNQGAAKVVVVPGQRLDASSAEGFKAEICGLIDSGSSHIILDLSQIEFMDSSGLGAIVACLKHMGGNGSIELANPRDPVMKVLRLTRMNKVFTVHQDRE